MKINKLCPWHLNCLTLFTRILWVCLIWHISAQMNRLLFGLFKTGKACDQFFKKKYEGYFGKTLKSTGLHLVVEKECKYKKNHPCRLYQTYFNYNYRNPPELTLFHTKDLLSHVTNFCQGQGYVSHRMTRSKDLKISRIHSLRFLPLVLCMHPLYSINLVSPTDLEARIPKTLLIFLIFTSEKELKCLLVNVNSKNP